MGVLPELMEAIDRMTDPAEYGRQLLEKLQSYQCR